LKKRVIGFPNNHEISISDTHDNVHFSSEMINRSSSTKNENDTKKNGRPRETTLEAKEKRNSRRQPFGLLLFLATRIVCIRDSKFL
jgi:hypothetical protein